MSLADIRQRMTPKVLRVEAPSFVQLQVDAQLASAIFQKALRRADRDLATRAGLLLVAVDPDRLWRRLTAVAFEDFGLSCLDVTEEVVAAASDKAWRERVGGDGKVVRYLVNRLAECARDRRTDELYMLSVRVSQHCDPGAAIDAIRASPALTRVVHIATEVVLRCEQPDGFRGMRTLLAKACDLELGRRLEQGWMDQKLYATCLQGRRTSKCLLPVLLPLVQWAWCQSSSLSQPGRRPVPPSPVVGGIPAYCIDGYSELGRTALGEVARRDRGLQKVLSWLPVQQSRKTCLRELLFAVEGGICISELSDPLYDELRSYSVGCWSGLPREALPEAFSAMLEAIPLLNWVRGQLMGRAA